MLFIGQSTRDIRRKLQKADGAGGMLISQLIKYKVYHNRDERERKEKQNKIKLQASLLAAAINGNDVEGKGRGKSKGRGGCGGIMQGRGPQN